MTAWYAGRNEIHSNLHTRQSSMVTNTKRRIGTVFSRDDGHIVARNM